MGKVDLDMQGLHHQTELFSLGGIWKASSLGREGPALGFCSSCPVMWWLWTVWSAHAFLCFSVFLPNTLFPAVPSFPVWSKLPCSRAVGCLYRVKSLRPGVRQT